MAEKFTTYVMIMSGLSLIFYFGGLVNTNPLLNFLLNTGSIARTTLYLALLSAITGVAAIVVGIVTKNVEMAVMTAVIPLLFTILWNFTEVIIALSGVSLFLSVIIFAPLMFVFILSGLDYWRGRD